MSGEDNEQFRQPSFLLKTVKSGYRQGTGHFQTYISIPLLVWYQILYLTGTLGALLPWRRTVSNVRHGKFRKGMWLPWKQPHEWAEARKEEKKRKTKTFSKIETAWWHSLQSFLNVSTNNLVDEDEEDELLLDLIQKHRHWVLLTTEEIWVED